MKKMAVAALTPGGASLARRIKRVLENVSPRNGPLCSEGLWNLPPFLEKLSLTQVDLYLPADLAEKGEKVLPGTSFQNSMDFLFRHYDYLACIMSTGIVVRMLSSCLTGKYTDPGVAVLDEKGRYAISLLGGHRGGGNDLARLLASCTSGEPVITTATDVLGRPHLEAISKALDCRTEPAGRSEKEVNAALARRETIFLFYDESLPPVFSTEFFHPLPLAELGRETGDKIHRLFFTNRWLPAISRAHNNFFLRPRNLVAGIGCRRGADTRTITEALVKTLYRNGLSPLSLKKIASAEMKRGEKGLIQAAEKLGAEMVFCSPAELEKAGLENNLQGSPMAKKHLGLAGVSQPAALLTAGTKELLLTKQVINGVTVALAALPFPGPSRRDGQWEGGKDHG